MPTVTATVVQDIDNVVGRFSIHVPNGHTLFPSPVTSGTYLRVRGRNSEGVETGEAEVLKASVFDDADKDSSLIVSPKSALAPKTSAESRPVSCAQVGQSQYLLFRLMHDKTLAFLSGLLMVQVLGAGTTFVLSMVKYNGQLTAVGLGACLFLLASLGSLISWYMAFVKLDQG